MIDVRQVILGKIIKIAGMILGCLFAIVVVFFGYITIVEYNPKPIEEVEFRSGSKEISVGDSLSVLTFNIGYGAYDQDEDFFMDGGEKVRPDSKKDIENNMTAIAGIINNQNADITFLQEVDIDSHRSYNVNEQVFLNISTGLGNAFAYNYNAKFVPFPMPPIGKVMSGVATYSDLQVNSASRISLPVPYKWPVKTCNLKRCILEERIPVNGSDRELVLLNIHLEAYDSGEGKVAQTKALFEKIEEEYAQGNYVLVGGDFNQQLQSLNLPEVKFDDDWMPGTIDEEMLPAGYSFAIADNLPTCRSLARSYVSKEESQTYIIDGFVVSDNIQVKSVKVLDEEFMYSDHNPVRLEIRIK